MKIALIGLLLGLVAFANGSLRAQDRQEKFDVPKVTTERPMSFWMKKKLELSKDMLEALTAADFATMEARAKQMSLIGKLEGMARGANMRYSAQLQQFDFTLADLLAQANDKNIQGATLAFNQMTTSCVACHNDLRRQAK